MDFHSLTFFLFSQCLNETKFYLKQIHFFLIEITFKKCLISGVLSVTGSTYCKLFSYRNSYLIQVKHVELRLKINWKQLNNVEWRLKKRMWYLESKKKNYEENEKYIFIYIFCNALWNIVFFLDIFPFYPVDFCCCK